MLILLTKYSEKNYIRFTKPYIIEREVMNIHMKFSVVIVTYNRLQLFQECLKCVEQQSKRFDEIIIVNNASTDGTKEYLTKCGKMDKLKIITTKENLGGAGGFRAGLQIVRDDIDYVLIIDDDAMLSLNFLEKIESGLEEGTKAYSGTVKVDGVIDTSHRRILKNRAFMIKQDVKMQDYIKQKYIYYDLSTFCGLVVSTEVLKKVGLPIAEYFIWYDDTEFSLRVRQYTKIKNINEAIINHKTVLSSTGGDLSWKSYYGYRNAIDMGRRHSEMPVIFVFYRYMYHIYRIIYYRLCSYGSVGKQSYYVNCAKLNKDVLIDSHKHVLGKSSNYFPGKNI